MDIKKYLPYVFPTIAVLIVVFLVFRWYRLNTEPQGEINQFAQGVEIENLSTQELQDSVSPVSDFETAELIKQAEAQIEGTGRVRYQLTDDKVKFSVYADLPAIESGQYQVWLTDLAGETQRKAFVLENGKGGFIGSASISSSVLPFEVVVSKEEVDDNSMEEVLFKTQIEK